MDAQDKNQPHAVWSLVDVGPRPRQYLSMVLYALIFLGLAAWITHFALYLISHSYSTLQCPTEVSSNKSREQAQRTFHTSVQYYTCQSWHCMCINIKRQKCICDRYLKAWWGLHHSALILLKCEVFLCTYFKWKDVQLGRVSVSHTLCQ